jgi:hypothetical protein
MQSGSQARYSATAEPAPKTTITAPSPIAPHIVRKRCVEHSDKY